MCNLNKIIAVAVIALFLGACSDKTQTESTSRPRQEEPRAVRTLESPLPDGFVLPLEYTVRDDRAIALKNGKMQRRMYLDFFDKDAERVRKDVTKMFKDAGFKASKPVPSKGGSLVNYRHEDGRHVSSIIWSDSERKILTPQATGTLFLGWTAGGAETAETAEESEE